MDAEEAASTPSVAHRPPIAQHITHAPSTGGLVRISTRRRASKNREMVRRDGPREDACRMWDRCVEGSGTDVGIVIGVVRWLGDDSLGVVVKEGSLFCSNHARAGSQSRSVGSSMSRFSRDE